VCVCVCGCVYVCVCVCVCVACACACGVCVGVGGWLRVFVSVVGISVGVVQNYGGIVRGQLQHGEAEPSCLRNRLENE